MRLMLLLVLILMGCGVPATARPEAVTPAGVVAAFKAAGLEAEQPAPMTREDYGPAPLVGEGVRFLIPSICPDCGGRAFVVPATADRDRLVTYYRELGKGSAAFFSHVYVRGPVVVQINGRLPDAQAARYEAALATLPA